MSGKPYNISELKNKHNTIQLVLCFLYMNSTR